ncbi:MAG: helix-turn-helix domain-containing protein, partial [Prevotella histicola]
SVYFSDCAATSGGQIVIAANGDVCRLLNISKCTLQHYRDTGVLPFTQIGHKCYYKREDVETLLLTKSDKPKNRQI